MSSPMPGEQLFVQAVDERLIHRPVPISIR
jgi:hypothetical protein